MSEKEPDPHLNPQVYIEADTGINLTEQVQAYLGDTLDTTVTGSISSTEVDYQDGAPHRYRIAFSGQAEGYGDVFDNFTYRFGVDVEQADNLTETANWHKFYNMDYDDPAFDAAQQQLIEAIGPITQAGSTIEGDLITFKPR